MELGEVDMAWGRNALVFFLKALSRRQWIAVPGNLPGLSSVPWGRRSVFDRRLGYQ